MINRHDISTNRRSCGKIFPRPVQVVYRQISLPVQELLLDSEDDTLHQLKELMRPERQRLDLRQAPLMRLQVAPDSRSSQWYALLQLHHFAADHESAEAMFAEVIANLEASRRSPCCPSTLPQSAVAQAPSG